MSTMITDTTNTPKVIWQHCAADEYRMWLHAGGAGKSRKLRIAAFDRIADKWARHYAA